MLYKIVFGVTIILLACMPCARAQRIGEYLGNEEFMYAETKQINQFFRRFNSEENLRGLRLSEKDKEYRDAEMRRNYIKMLFDRENNQIADSLKTRFIKDVTARPNPEFLDFYGGRWFAEVSAQFQYEGQSKRVVLFLELERENLGIKWVISNLYFQPFTKLFYTDTSSAGRFLHPMSHELDFMNLIKVFTDTGHVEYYFDEDYKPDFRTLFLYEVKRGNLKFEQVREVKFHFFQINNWYFELSEFNRNGPNSGWLISNLMPIPEEQKDMLLKYIYYED